MARGKRTTINNGIIVLDPDDKDSLSAGGNPVITVKGTAAVLVNSMHAEAMIANGNAQRLLRGGLRRDRRPGLDDDRRRCVQRQHQLRRPAHPGSASIDPATQSERHDHPQHQGGSSIRAPNTITLRPGVYEGGISVSGKGNVFMEPGIYYMRGGFSFSGQGSVTGHGVMIYNDPQSNSDAIDLSGQGAITLSPPADGPYQGISLFQRRDGSDQPTVSVSGNGTAPSKHQRYLLRGGGGAQGHG